ncbi:MAG: DUF2121 domain-containing protein [Methanobrevibacter sp.]|nr:DUF2121 domain-containing protein [Methanobrevibacter sp.]
MSLIIAYVGKKGCVMASDKRKIAYFGDKDKREELEEEIYSGAIKSDDELYKRASDLDMVIKVSEDSNKIRDIEDVIVGEVSSKSTFETKRKRIYGTTNGYQIIELLGSDITSSDKGEKAIILFGNKITKSLANELLDKKWKPDFSLKYMGDIFGNILKEISKQTPSIGKEYDVMVKNPALTTKKAQNLLDETISRDIKLLNKFREKLKENLLLQSESIKMATKIINEGEIGKVVNIEDKILHVCLNSDVQAFDTNWKQLAKPGENVLMFIEKGDNAEIGDLTVIENETLCIKRNKANLQCNIILCNI